jgi:hypothetical protein
MILRYLRIFTAFIFVFSLLGMMVWFAIDKEKRHDVQICDVNSSNGIVFFIIDISDPFEKGDIDYVNRDVVKNFSHLNPGTLVILLKPNQYSYYEPIEYPTLCSVKEKTQLDRLLMTEEEITENNKHQQELTKELTLLLDGLLNSKTESKSPILETLIYVTKRFDFQNYKKNEIYLYSDMEQNTESLSTYKNIPKISVLKSIYFDSFDFRNASIFAKKIAHHKNHKNTNKQRELILRNFWEQWVSTYNGKLYWQ